MLPGERASETSEVARWRLDALARVPVAVGQVREEPRERSDVLVVVARDVCQWACRAAAQELVVATGDLPAFDVADTMQAEELGFGRPEAGIGHPVAEQTANDWEQVEV